jgi:hypothetical protein
VDLSVHLNVDMKRIEVTVILCGSDNCKLGIKLKYKGK